MANDSVVAEISALLNKSAEPVQEAVQDEVVEVVDEAIEEVDDVVDEADVDGEQDEDVPDSEADDEPRTIKQLAEAIDVDTEYLYGIEIGMGDNQEPISIGKLKDEVQESRRNLQKMQEDMASQAEQIEQAQSTVGQFQQVSQDEQAAQQEMALLNKEYNEIDWEKFKREDPGNAALHRQEMGEKYQQAQYKLQQIQNYQSQQEQQSMQDMKDKLLELVPEWTNADVRTKEQSEIRELLISEGYTDNMLANARDPIAIKLARELIQLRKEKADVTQNISKVRNAPQVLRTANGRFAEKKGKAVQDIVAKAKQSPNKQTELAAAKALLGM